MSVDQMWNSLIETGAVSEETLQVVVAINGCSEETMRDVLYATTGYRDFDQMDEED